MEMTDRERHRLEMAIERFADASALKAVMTTSDSIELAQRAVDNAWDVVSSHLTRIQTGEYEREPEDFGWNGDSKVRGLI